MAIIPHIVCHRGACGYRPEHTLEAFQLAIQMGGDFIEPDLVTSRDGALIVRHENELSLTTDVANHPEFASRRTTKVIDGKPLTGWFTEDFTLSEIKKLRAKEHLPQLRPQNTAYDNLYPIPTFQEVMDLVRIESARRGRSIGVFPETKHSSYFNSIGISLEELLVEALDRNDYRDGRSPIFIQSFEPNSLKRLRSMTQVPLIQLVNTSGQPYDWTVSGDARTFADLVTRDGLTEVATYAQGISPHKDLVIPRDAEDRLLPPTSLVEESHAAGLVIYPYTFRNENFFLPRDFQVGTLSNPNNRQDPTNLPFYQAHGDAVSEYTLFFELGVDGVFSEHPDTALTARRDLKGEY